MLSRFAAAGIVAVMLAATVQAQVYTTPGGTVIVPNRYGRRGVQGGYPPRGLGRNRRNTNQRPQNGQKGAQAKKGPSVDPKGKGTKADIDLASEVQALKGRHPSLVAKLPTNLRRLDTQATTQVVDKLPLIAQHSYYTTVEDYPNLAPADQTKFGDVLRGLTNLPDTDRQRYIDQASTSYKAIEADPTQLKSARRQPHPTFFKLADDFAPKPAASAPKPAISAPKPAAKTTSK